MGKDITLDHILPVANGGPDTFANTQVAHFLCNQKKGSFTMLPIDEVGR